MDNAKWWMVTVLVCVAMPCLTALEIAYGLQDRDVVT